MFGRARVEQALDRIMRAVVDWGYAAQPSRKALNFTLCEVLLVVQSPQLEDITLDHLTQLRAAAPAIRGFAAAFFVSRARWQDSG